MSHVQPDPEQAARAAEAAADPAVLRAEGRLAMLRELAEIGMRLTRALERRALAEEAAQDPAADAGPAGDRARGFDPPAAFSSLSRAVRLTLALEARTDEALRALKAGVEEERLEAAKTDRDAAIRKWQDREAQIRDLVMEAAEADMRNEGDWERLESELEMHLTMDQDFWSDPERPLRKIVERYCGYFHLAPDWSRWDGEEWTPPGPPDPPAWPWADARPTEPVSSPTQNPAGKPTLALAAAHDLE